MRRYASIPSVPAPSISVSNVLKLSLLHVLRPSSYHLHTSFQIDSFILYLFPLEIEHGIGVLNLGLPLYLVYRYVPPQRVWFLSRFGLKTVIDFEHFGLKLGMVIWETFTKAYKLIFLPSNWGE